MARSYQLHFDEFCKGTSSIEQVCGIVLLIIENDYLKKRRPDQILPVKIWKAVEGDISKQFFNGENISTCKRQLKAKLTAFLKDLRTGTANGEHDPKPELSNIDLIPASKSSDVYASHVMAQKREGAIESIMTTPSKIRKADPDPAKQADSTEVPEVFIKKKVDRAVQLP
jgi:hypothetical protein